MNRSTANWLMMLHAAFVTIPIAKAENAQTNLAPLRYEEPRTMEGRIYAIESDRKTPLFNFRRQATRSGDTLQVLREYSFPDGKLAARERVSYVGDDLVAYEIEDLQIGAKGRAQIQRDKRDSAKRRIHFEYSNEPESKPKTDSETLQKNTLVNDMLGPFLMSHFDNFIKGERLKCRYIVVSRRETVGLSLRKHSESTYQGRSVIIIKMEPTSPIIAAIVDPIFFTMEKDAPHRVLEYSGRTTPKIRSDGKWKDLDAVTVFDWK